MSLAQLEAEVQRRGLSPTEIEVVGTRDPVIVRIWCDFDGERMMTQEVVPMAEIETTKEALAGVWLRWLAYEDERR
jgi:hypothetical protein